MSSFLSSQPNQKPQSKSRSIGVKLIVVCGLALMMAVPALFVDSLVDERKGREADVRNEISAHVGGPQTFLGPVLAIPYNVPPVTPSESTKHGTYIVFPANAEASVKTVTEERHRSLFRVPVFKAELKLESLFDLKGVPASAPAGAQLEWGRAEIVVGVHDARGALADATLTSGGSTLPLAPSDIAQGLALAGGENHLKLTWFGVQTALSPASEPFKASAMLKFSGSERLAVLPYGKTTHLIAEGDWRSPGFDGGMLPVSRSVTEHGFQAEWSVPFIARGVQAEGPSEILAALDPAALGISFVEVADPYQSVTRSLKYILLFLVLVFLTYFIFETTTGKRVHPAQYGVIGIAQSIFYLLLLSLAERLGFDWAFLLAGAATVSLLGVNAGWIFSSRLQGMRAFGVFTMLYTFIYLLLRLEDNALLVGAMASFAVVAAVMYFTRNIDWYSSSPVGGSAGEMAAAPLADGAASYVVAALRLLNSRLLRFATQ